MSFRKPAGFTLLELLVVIVIIAIMTSVAMLSMNVLGHDSQIDDEARRLSALIGVVHEQAEMQNRDFGLRLDETQYDFMAYDVRHDEWLGVEGDDLMRRRQLPKGLRMKLELDGRAVILKPIEAEEKTAESAEKKPTEPRIDKDPELLEIGEEEKKKAAPPQIFILSSGDLSPFELKLERESEDRSATLIGKTEGSVEFRGVDYVDPRK